MTSTDEEAQNNELIALASIYENSFISVTANNSAVALDSFSDNLKGGELKIDIELPHSFFLYSINKIKNVHEKHFIEYLPPIFLNFHFPEDYPSRNSPEYTLSCNWLSSAQLSCLCSQLDNLWKSNINCEVMFTWAMFLKEKTLEIAKITNFLDIENITPRRSRTFSSDDKTKYNSIHCDTSDTNAECSDVDAVSDDSRAIQNVGPNTNLLKLLVDYDNEMRKSAFDAKTFHCKICFTEQSGVNCIDFYPCHHVYCKKCIRSFFEVQIQEGNIKSLKCPEVGCSSEANPKQVELLVSKELYNRYDDILLSTTLSSLGDIQLCPRKHCQYPVTIDDSQGQCPSCSYVFCGFCRFGSHGIEKCKFKSGEAKEILELYINGDENSRKELQDRYGVKYLESMKNQYLSANYISNNCKECPRCRTSIEKIDGCNKMTCKRCGNNFCWLCEQILRNTNPYSHFNDPKSKCYDLLFHGIDINDDDEDFEEFEDEDF